MDEPQRVTLEQQVFLNKGNFLLSSNDFQHNFSLIWYFYRPQTKFAKFMFLHVSVCHSVHRGGGVQTQGEVEDSGQGGGCLGPYSWWEVEGFGQGACLGPNQGGS